MQRRVLQKKLHLDFYSERDEEEEDEVQEILYVHKKKELQKVEGDLDRFILFYI